MIITLCGSARFEPWFHAWSEALGLSGHCVFGLVAYPSQHEGVKGWYSDEEKTVIDEVHKDKIDASDAIVVLNAFAYIGESTLTEVAYANKEKASIYFLESWGRGLGIDGGHNKTVRDAALRFGVPVLYGSPIDTTNGRDLWSLLPDAGPRRSGIVNMLERRLKPLGRSL